MDVKVEGPNNQIIYQEQKKQYDSHQFTAQHTGKIEITQKLFVILLYYIHLAVYNVFRILL